MNNNINIKDLRAAVRPYIKPSNKLALLIFLTDILIYASAIAGIILIENTVIRILLGTLAGLRIGTLFLISHDSAHGSFTSNSLLNKVIGRIAFLPSFHNYSLWLIAHNQAHHQSPNVKGINSWSPLSKDEFDKLPVWRKNLEKLYRSPFGIPINYMVERWWKDKFFPYKRIVKNRSLTSWLDFVLVATYMFSFFVLLVVAGMKMTHTNPVELLLLALALPFFVSNFLIGVTIYQHHTHEIIPWFNSVEESSYYANQEDLTMNVQYPNWYNFISNNAMIHTAHHIDPRIPLYNTAKAQSVLLNILGDKMITMKFSLSGFLTTMKNCKLYDYDTHCWLDFNGNRTAEPSLPKQNIEYAEAA